MSPQGSEYKNTAGDNCLFARVGLNKQTGPLKLPQQRSQPTVSKRNPYLIEIGTRLAHEGQPASDKIVTFNCGNLLTHKQHVLPIGYTKHEVNIVIEC